MKKLLLLLTILFAPALVYGQGFQYRDIALNGAGQPLAGISIAVCAPLATTATNVTNNVATFTMASNPVTAGFLTGQTIAVTGFTGGDTFFNAGTASGNTYSAGYTIISVTSTQIIVQLTHANATASSNGVILQEGNSSTPCAGQSALYSDYTLTTPLTQPIMTDGLGNFAFAIASGQYWLEEYGPSVTTTFKQITAGGTGGSGNTNATYVTSTDQVGTLPNSREIVDGANTSVNLGTAGEIKIDASESPTFFGPSPWWRDVTSSQFGGCIYDRSQIISNSFGSIVAGTKTLTLSAAWPGLKNNCGIVVSSAGPQATVVAPALHTSSGAYNAGTTYAAGDTVTYGGNTFYSLTGGNIGVTPLNDVTGKWFPVAIQKGPCQLFVNASPTQGVCGSTTYSYAIASRDVLGGVGAATATFTVTAAAEPTSDEVVIVHSDWVPTTTYALHNVVRFRGQLYISQQATNTGNSPYQNPSWWGAMIGGPNYIWLSGPLVSGARGYVIWKKVGAGAWNCLTTTYSQNDSNDQKFHYEDHGEVPNCSGEIPATPPATALFDPFISTVASGEGTTNLVLGTNATTTVSSVHVYPDNSAAMDAALVQANADILQPQGLRSPAPCILIPAGGFFYLSHFDPLHAVSGLPNAGTIHVCISGSPVLVNMPFFVNISNMDIEGYDTGGGAGPGTTPIYFQFGGTGFVVADLSLNPGIEGSGGSANGEHIHRFQNVSNGPQLITTGVGPSVNQFDSLRFGTGTINPNVIIGGDNITWSMDNFIFDGPSSDYGDDSILLDLPNGGTTNTWQIGGTTDSEIFNKAFTIRSPFANPNKGGCAVQQFKFQNLFTESTVSPGYLNSDNVASSYHEGCSMQQGTVVQGGALDPLVGVAHMYGANGPGFNAIDFQGFLQAGPMVEGGSFNGAPLIGGGQVYVNSDAALGGNVWGSDGPTTNVESSGVETNGYIQATQDLNGSHPSHTMVAARPYMTAPLTTMAGGSFTAGTYFYYVTLCTTAGLTNCTNVSGGISGSSIDNYEEVFVKVTLNQEVVITINHTYATTPCDHYNVWRGATSNTEDHYFTVACPSGLAGVATLTDTGTAGTAGTTPKVNTAYLFSVDITGGVNNISNITTTKAFNGYSLYLNETTAPSGTSAIDIIYGRTSNHWPQLNANNAGAMDLCAVDGPRTAGHALVFSDTTTCHVVDGGAPGGGGSVTTFSVAADPTPLFTTSVTNPGTTPALSFAQSNFLAHKFYGNPTSSTGTPLATLIGTSDTSVNWYKADTGAADAAVVTLAPAATALTAGLEVDFLPTAANATTTPTVNVSGLGAKTITKLGTAALAANDLTTTAVAKIIYDGTGFQLQNPQTTASSGANTALSNLAAVAINATLIPGTAAATGLGTTAKPFGTFVIGNAANQSAAADVSNLTGNRTVVIPNTNSVIPVPIAATSATFLASLTSPTGVLGTKTLTSTTGASGVTVTDTAGVVTVAPANVVGGGNAILQCTETGGAPGDYFALNGSSVCVNQTPGIVPNPQTGASYTILTGDRGKIITRTNAGNMTEALPQAGSAGFASNFYYCVSALGGGKLTITPATSTINGAATLVLLTGQSACINSDNTNYIARVTGYASGTTGSISGAIVGVGCDTGTATILGAAAGMNAVASATTDPGDGLFIKARVSSADTVTVSVCGATITPTASTYLVRVFP